MSDHDEQTPDLPAASGARLIPEPAGTADHPGQDPLAAPSLQRSLEVDDPIEPPVPEDLPLLPTDLHTAVRSAQDDEPVSNQELHDQHGSLSTTSSRRPMSPGADGPFR